MAEQTPDNIITTQRNGQTIVAELFFNHSSTETFRDKLLKLVLADSTRLSASDGQEPEKTETLWTRNVSPERFLLENRRFSQVKSREKHPKNAPTA